MDESQKLYNEVKKARNKGLNAISFHSHEILRKGKAMETESKPVVAEVGRRSRNWLQTNTRKLFAVTEVFSTWDVMMAAQLHKFTKNH